MSTEHTHTHIHTEGKTDKTNYIQMENCWANEQTNSEKPCNSPGNVICNVCT